MAQRHSELTAAGVRTVGISVDDPGANAAMVDKLQLPFPLLSDPGGDAAIKPYDVWNADREIAKPAAIVISGGEERDEAFRFVSRDYADRMTEDELVAAVQALGYPSTSQAAPAPGEPEPGERAMPVRALAPYFRGARFAALAIGGRIPEAKAEAEALTAEADRYAAAAATLAV